MNVKVLPHIVCFVNGQVKDHVVGFDELGNTDTFRREQLEDRLGQSGESAVVALVMLLFS